jgi:hypothetical protein
MINSIIGRVLAGGLLLACGSAFGQRNSVERPCPAARNSNWPGFGTGKILVPSRTESRRNDSINSSDGIRNAACMARQ